MHLVAAAVAATAVLGVAGATPPIQLTTGVHHLVDGALLASTSGTTFALGSVAKDTDNPLIVPEHPWEAAVHFYTTAVFVPAGAGGSPSAAWLLYYACSDGVLFFTPISVCVANSTDGKAWNKPLLPYHPYTANGTRPPVDTNIVFVTGANTFLGQVLLDVRHGVPPSQRFVMAYEEGGERYVNTATSADGYAWSPSSADSAAPHALPFPSYADTMVSLLYDLPRDRYVAYGRQDETLPNSTGQCAGGYGSERWVLQSVKPCVRGSACNVSTPDGWRPWTIALAPGQPDPYSCVDSYNPSALSFPDGGTGALYLLLPSSFRHIPEAESGAPDSRAAGNDGFMDIRLAVSRDPAAVGGLQSTARNGSMGGAWGYPSRDPWIPRGVGGREPSSGLYNASGSERDAGFVFATAGGWVDPDAPLLAPGQYTLPSPSTHVYQLYWGSQTTHAGGGAYLYRYWPGAFTGIFRARMRREGWVALATDPTDPSGTGSATTLPLLLPPVEGAGGGPLLLRFNAEVGAAGGLSVAVLDAASGAPLPGFNHTDFAPLYGNGVRQVAVWAGAGAGGDLAPLSRRGAPVVLQLLLVHAKVYAWELAVQA